MFEKSSAPKKKYYDDPNDSTIRRQKFSAIINSKPSYYPAPQVLTFSKDTRQTSSRHYNHSSSTSQCQQQQQHDLKATQSRQDQFHNYRSNANRSNSYLPRPSSMILNPLGAFKLRKDRDRKRLLESYYILGYIAAGTYGKVYKATSNSPAFKDRLFAIKKFKADKEGEIVHYTGISQSACREMALCREMDHKNVIKLFEVILEDKSIFIVFDFAEHDLLQIIHYHTQPDKKPIPESIIKSVIWQILNGLSYLHQNWILHRDLKPANIMVTSEGVVKIGDLGLARLFSDPLQTLFSGDKVVVTIWYRAPELLLGGRHYTPAIDLWAVGCILGELLALKPIFKGEEAKMDNKKNAPFPFNQFQKVIDVLGSPTAENWPSLPKHPEYPQFRTMKKCHSNVNNWYHSHVLSQPNHKAFGLFTSLLEYDPAKRITANDALVHDYFKELPRITENVFSNQNYQYPTRRISNDDNDIKANNNKSSHHHNNNKRQNPNDYADPLHARKKHR